MLECPLINHIFNYFRIQPKKRQILINSFLVALTKSTCKVFRTTRPRESRRVFTSQRSTLLLLLAGMYSRKGRMHENWQHEIVRFILSTLFGIERLPSFIYRPRNHSYYCIHVPNWSWAHCTYTSWWEARTQVRESESLIEPINCKWFALEYKLHNL